MESATSVAGFPREAQLEDEIARATDVTQAQPPTRLTSLDAFRGLTILGMLLVNNIALDGATPQQLTHAAWNQGLHFADLVFPWFLLIVGVAIPFSEASHRRKGLPLWRYDLRVVGRVVGLFLLGCLIDSSFARQPVFDLGVLQLIGLAYGVAACLYALPLGRRMAVAGLLLLAHWAAIRFIPIPGVGAGVFTEEHNLIDHLNATYLQPLHIDGLISVVPTAALALIGTALGELLRRSLPAMRKVTILLASGLVLVIVGWLWSLDLPFNKAVWSAPYILYSAGWGTLLLGVLYLTIDVVGWATWAYPLVVFGANAIAAYVAPLLVKAHLLQVWNWTLPDGSQVPLQQAMLQFCIDHAGRIAGGWVYTVAYIVVCWLLLMLMHRRRLFIRV